MGVAHVICTVNMNRSVKAITHWNSIKSTMDKQKKKNPKNQTNKKKQKNKRKTIKANKNNNPKK